MLNHLKLISRPGNDYFGFHPSEWEEGSGNQTKSAWPICKPCSQVVSCPDYFSPSGREKYGLGTRLVPKRSRTRPGMKSTGTPLASFQGAPPGTRICKRLQLQCSRSGAEKPGNEATTPPDVQSEKGCGPNVTTKEAIGMPSH